MPMGHAIVRSWRNASFALDPVAIALLAVVVRSFHTEHAPLYDELYHVLAARSWATDGSLAINGGVYTRGAYFTIMTGWMFERFGVSLTVARSLPILSGSLLVLSVFLWTRMVAGRTAAWVAALLICFSPSAILDSQFIRFYSLHALLFFWGAVGIYGLVTAEVVGERRRVVIIVSSAVSLSLALHFQVTTLVGLVGLSSWLMIALGPGWASRIKRMHRYRAIGMGALVLVIAGGIAFIQSDTVEHLLDLAQQKPLWMQRSEFYVYHGIFLKYYPVLWGLLPVAWLYAIARKGQPAVFCCSVFAVSLLLHAFFPLKGLRYISYLMPFFFVLWGMVYAEILSHVRNVASAAVRQVLPGSILSESASRRMEWLSVSISTVFLLVSNSAFVNAAKIIVRGPLHVHPQYNVEWAAARGVLKPLTETAGIVITTNGLSALYHLDRFDIEFSASHLHELKVREEFSVDHRTGHPVISKLQSLRQLMMCYPEGLVIAEAWHWKTDGIVGIDDESVGLLVRNAEPVRLPAEANLIAFRWHHPRHEDLFEGLSAGTSVEDPRHAEDCRVLRNRISNRRAPG
jgi:hypothetical protein